MAAFKCSIREIRDDILVPMTDWLYEKLVKCQANVSTEVT